MLHPMIGTISLDDVNLFLAVAELESFSRAAERTRVPTSTLSRRIHALEQGLGLRLLQRSSRSVAVTPEGAALLERAAPLMQELWAATELGDDRELSGPVRVTAPVSIGADRVAPALFAFAARHPKVELEVTLENATVDVIERGLDFAVRAAPVKSAELVARPLWSVPFALGASRELVARELGGKPRISRARVTKLPAIVTRQSPRWHLLQRGQPRVVRPAARVVVSDPRLAVDPARKGLGLVCVPDSLLRDLVRVQITGHQVAPRAVYVVYPSRQLPARVRAAIEWLRAHG